MSPEKSFGFGLFSMTAIPSHKRKKKSCCTPAALFFWE
jgi:hypothetical protein